MLVPHDIQHVMSLLSPTELLLWESGKKSLKALLNNYKSEDRRAHFTVEHLSGEGQLEKPQEQAQHLHKAILEDIKNTAESALFQTPDGTTPQQNF